MDTAYSKWRNFYCQKKKGLMYPNETLVRFFKGTYMPAYKPNYEGMKVLDVGFGTGNNSMFLGSLGMKLFGVEVGQEICKEGMKKLKSLGLKADFRVGTNSDLPFEDNSFDYLVSWDVIHYEGSEKKIIKAVEEYHRVLKPGGWLFLSTVAPQHTILQGSEVVGAHCYEIGLESDFRRGQVFFYFDSPRYIEHYFSKRFSKIRIGRVTLEYFTYTNDTFILNAVNKS